MGNSKPKTENQLKPETPTAAGVHGYEFHNEASAESGQEAVPCSSSGARHGHQKAQEDKFLEQKIPAAVEIKTAYCRLVGR